MSTMEFVLINLQVCIVQTATVLQLEFTTDFFQNMLQRTIFRAPPQKFPAWFLENSSL